jgi:transcriptional regulator with XRE-family HTH domain
MSPEDIKALRQELGCTARELAGALGIEQAEVIAWERGDLFPTKRFCDAMEALRKKGPSAIPKKPRRKAAAATPMAALSDPDLWRLVRKLLAHPELRSAAQALAERYTDPADEG